MGKSTIVSSPEEICRSIEQQGFAVIPDALDAPQIAIANGVIDADLQANSRDWARFDESLIQTVDLLSRTGELDFTIENPATPGPLRMCFGEEIAFEEFGAIVREPTFKPSDIKGFHRDMIRDYNSRQRRTFHLYYWLANRPRTTEWNPIPPRLYEKVDAALPPLLYSKWNMTESIDGVGRKPRDLDSSMSAADMLMEVQRRANKKS